MGVLDVNLHGFLFNLHHLSFLVAFRCKQVNEEKQNSEPNLVSNHREHEDYAWEQFRTLHCGTTESCKFNQSGFWEVGN